MTKQVRNLGNKKYIDSCKIQSRWDKFQTGQIQKRSKKLRDSTENFIQNLSLYLCLCLYLYLYHLYLSIPISSISTYLYHWYLSIYIYIYLDIVFIYLFPKGTSIYQKVETSNCKMIKSWYLTYSIVIVVNNSVLYIWKFLGE